MFTTIDHAVIAVPDLSRGLDTFTRLGFEVHPGGIHPGAGTHNAIAFNQEEYLELLAIRDPAEYEAAVARGERPPGLAELAARGGGFHRIALQSDDLEADVDGMRRRSGSVGPVLPGSRTTNDGRTLRWLVAYPEGASPPPLFFIQHLTPLGERRTRRTSAGTPGDGREWNHPNGVERLDRAYIVTEDVAAEAEFYARLLGVPVPQLQQGTVINAAMAVFQLGQTGLTLAQPSGPGPAQEALARRGPGPFQALYRTASLQAAIRWITDHGLPEPARGTRNTGEQAALVPPDIACGAYIGFAGPA